MPENTNWSESNLMAIRNVLLRKKLICGDLNTQEDYPHTSQEVNKLLYRRDSVVFLFVFKITTLNKVSV